MQLIADNPRLKPYVFVTGCDRSGTTLLQRMLNDHPDLLITYEVGISGKLADLYRTEGFEATFNRLSELKHAFKAVDFDAVRAAWQQLPDAGFAELVALTYQHAASAEGKALWGDKRPSLYCSQMDQLVEMFPHSYLIHIVRDPRAVALSWEKTRWGPQTTYHAAKAWRRIVGNAVAGAERYFGSRAILIKYEDLLTDPAQVLKSICAMLEIDFSPAMLDDQQPDAKISGVARIDTLHSKALAKPDASRVESWSRAPRRVIRHIEQTCAELMNQLDYAATTDPRGSVALPWRAFYLTQSKLKRRPPRA